MSVKIRLSRMGSNKNPFYRIVVADVRSPRDGKFIEKIGIYDPKSEPSRIEVDRDKALEWIKRVQNLQIQFRNFSIKLD